MTVWEELGLLFREMSPWTPIFLITGIILIVIDAFDTGFDLPGILGLVSIIAGITIRMLNDGTLLMFFVMLFFVVLVIALSVFLIFRSAEKGWLSRTALFDKTPAVPYERTEGTPDYSGLIGATGETVTMLKPVGKIKIEDVLYDAVCESAFIEAGATIEVVETAAYRIVVRAK